MNLKFLNEAADVLLSPFGMAIVFVAVIALVCSFFTRRIALWLCIILLWVSMFGTCRAVTLWSPFQFMAVNARVLAIMGLIAVCMTLLSHMKFPAISFGICGWMVYSLCSGSVFITGGDLEKGVGNLFSALLLFLIFGVGINSFLDSPETMKKVLGIHFWAFLLFLAVCQIQLMIDPSIGAARFYGVSGNPQACGWALATGGICLLTRWFTTSPKNVFSRVFIACIGLFSLILLLWTGSRTAWLMAIVGGVTFFRRRLGVLLFGFIPMMAIFLGFLFLQPDLDGGTNAARMDESSEDGGAISSAANIARNRDLTSDSRSAVWTRLWNEFTDSPIVGQMEFIGGESSYLGVAASMGVVGLGLMGLAFFAGLVDLLRVHSCRGLLCRDDQILFDYVLANLVAIAVGGIFDGTLRAFVTIWGILPYYLLMLLNYLVRRAYEAEAMEDTVAFVDDGSSRATYRLVEDAFGGLQNRLR